MSEDQTEIVSEQSLTETLEEPQNPLDGLLPEPIYRALSTIWDKHPELFDVDEEELESELKVRGLKRPGTTINQLRLRFWYEVNFQRLQKTPSPVEARRICSGVCSVQAFYALLSRPEAAAWILCMPISSERHLEEMVSFGQAWERKVMMQDPGFSEGPGAKFDTKLAKLQYEIVSDAKARLLGTVATKELHLHASLTKKEAIEVSGSRDIDSKVKQLVNAQERRINPPKDPKRPIIELEPNGDA